MEKDKKIKKTQTESILEFLTENTKNHQWTPLSDFELKFGYSQSSISAQLRNLRKKKYGSHIIEKKYDNKKWYYKLGVQKKESEQLNLFD